jgi:hypothetical protein
MKQKLILEEVFRIREMMGFKSLNKKLLLEWSKIADETMPGGAMDDLASLGKTVDDIFSYSTKLSTEFPTKTFDSIIDRVAKDNAIDSTSVTTEMMRNFISKQGLFDELMAVAAKIANEKVGGYTKDINFMNAFKNAGFDGLPSEMQTVIKQKITTDNKGTTNQILDGYKNLIEGNATLKNSDPGKKMLETINNKKKEIADFEKNKTTSPKTEVPTTKVEPVEPTTITKTYQELLNEKWPDTSGYLSTPLGRDLFNNAESKFIEGKHIYEIRPVGNGKFEYKFINNKSSFTRAIPYSDKYVKIVTQELNSPDNADTVVTVKPGILRKEGDGFVVEKKAEVFYANSNTINNKVEIEIPPTPTTKVEPTVKPVETIAKSLDPSEIKTNVSSTVDGLIDIEKQDLDIPKIEENVFMRKTGYPGKLNGFAVENGILRVRVGGMDFMGRSGGATYISMKVPGNFNETLFSEKLNKISHENFQTTKTSVPKVVNDVKNAVAQSSNQSKIETPTIKPVEPTIKPVEPTIKPVEPTIKPIEPTIKPIEPKTQSSSYEKLYPLNRNFYDSYIKGDILPDYFNSWMLSLSKEELDDLYQYMESKK